MTLTNLVRARDWWDYKIPPLLAVAYATAFMSELSFWTSAIAIVATLVFLVATASFGYFLNDLCDIKVDRSVGRHSGAAELSIAGRIAVLAGLLGLVFAPWIVLPRSVALAVLVFVELALFVAYSAPPIRLKGRGVPALVADAAYAHTIPILIVALTFAALAEGPFPSVAFAGRSGWVLGLLAGWSFLVGLRGILLHQVDDLDDDIRARVRTAVSPTTRGRAISIVALVLLPAEVLSFGALALLASTPLPYFVVYAGVVFALLIIRALREARRETVTADAASGRWRLSDDLDDRARLERTPHGAIRVVSGSDRIGNAWDVRLQSRPVLARADEHHRLRLRVRSERARPLELSLTQAVEPWARLGPYEALRLTSAWQHVTLEIPAPVVDIMVCVQLNLGSGVGPVEIDDVELSRTSDGAQLLVEDTATAQTPEERMRSHRRRRFADFLGAWVLNDFYEKWMPLHPLLLLSVTEPAYCIVAAVHLVLFRSAWRRGRLAR